jgi:choline-sulfatase
VASGSLAGPQDSPVPVILISVDTLRADHLSSYGYRRIRTPNIDSFAEGGTRFTAIDSQIPLTLPSHTSLFTSTYPFANGIEENGERVPAGMVTLAATLEAQGYQTAAFVGSILLDRRLGLDQGFEFYDSPFELAPSRQNSATWNPYAARVRRDGALVIRAARQYLEAHRGQKVFVFVHLFDLHTPYAHAANAGAMPEATGYDTELAHVDELLGRFRESLVARGWWDRSLVVLLSDHGESLGDHGESSHGYFVYQSTLWVPLMFHWPGERSRAGVPLPQRVDRPGGLIDVAPTVLQFLGIARPSTFAGVSLLEQASAHPVYSESVYARDAFRWAPLRSLREEGFQLIDAPKPELYDLRGDPRERSSVLDTHREEAAKLQADLEHLQSGAVPAAHRADARLHALESLGYVAAAADGEANRQAPDPKDRLEEYNLFEGDLANLYGGHPTEAVTGFRKLISRDPQNTMARYYLGEAYLRLHQPEEAVREWNQAVKRDPKYEPLCLALGEVWLERADYDRARSWFLQAETLAPADPDAARGAALAEEHLGVVDRARAHWEKACRLEPEFAECRAPHEH